MSTDKKVANLFDKKKTDKTSDKPPVYILNYSFIGINKNIRSCWFSIE